jgi:hypothetical protein
MRQHTLLCCQRHFSVGAPLAQKLVRQQRQQPTQEDMLADGANQHTSLGSLLAQALPTTP